MPSKYDTFDNLKEEEKKLYGGENKSKEATFTIEDAVEHIGFGPYQLKLGAMTGLSWIADSMEIMVLSILSPVMICEWKLSVIQAALITTVVFIGYLIGSPLSGLVSDRYGRKFSLMFFASTAMYFGLLSALSPIYAFMLLLRCLTGIGIGGTPQAVTIFTEFLPSTARGKGVVTLQVFWAVGGILEVILALLILPTLGWRWWLGISAVPLLIFVILCIPWLPESPRYQVACGDHIEAYKTLVKMAKENRKSLPPGKLIPEPQAKRGKFRDLVAPSLLKVTLLSWVIWFSTALSYYGIILLSTGLIRAGSTCHPSVAPQATESCGVDCIALTHQDYIDLVITSCAELPGLLVTAFLVDSIGRKHSMTLLIFIYVGCVLLLFMCTGRIIMLGLLFVARSSIAAGFQVAFIYTPEVYPTSIRALGLGVCSGFARIGSVITPFVGEVLLSTSLYSALGLYAFLAILGGVACFFLPYDTKGRSMMMGVH